MRNKFVVSALLVSVLLVGMAAAQLPRTIYDPIQKRNFPAEDVSQERLAELLEQNSALFSMWNDVEAVRALYESRQQGMQTQETSMEDSVGNETTTREALLEELGIITIYDPSRRENRYVSRVSTQELGCLLVNEQSLRKTFENDEKRNRARTAGRNLNAELENECVQIRGSKKVKYWTTGVSNGTTTTATFG